MNSGSHEKSFTITVPALNEEAGLVSTLDQIHEVMKQGFSDYEILVFDDGSTDRTGAMAEEYAKHHPRVRVIHNPTTRGIGYSYKEGIRLATKKYYTLIHGDNEIMGFLMKEMFTAAGREDFVITVIRQDTRSSARQRISKTFTGIVNGMFGLKVPYYNGPSLIPVKLLKEIPIHTNGHAFMAEIIVRLLKRGYKYHAIEFDTIVRAHGKTKAFRIKNVLSVSRALLDLRLTCR